MSDILHELGLDRLPRADRLVLVQQLWDSLGSDARPTLSDAQLRELERRADEDDASPDDVISWEEVKARTAARLRP